MWQIWQGRRSTKAGGYQKNLKKFLKTTEGHRGEDREKIEIGKKIISRFLCFHDKFHEKRGLKKILSQRWKDLNGF